MPVLPAPETPGLTKKPASEPPLKSIDGWSRFCRDRLMSAMQKLKYGSLRLTDPESSRLFGVGESDEPPAELSVNDPLFYRSIVTGGSLGAAEAYLKGWWDSPDLVLLFRLMARNAEALGGLNGVASRLSRGAAAVGHALRRNTHAGSRRNIAAHYDLGEEFYALFLDETMTYSSGIFPTEESSLADASSEKYDRVCRKLRLAPGHHIVEIGTGWGGFALHAAKQYGCRVTTTTISAKQNAHATRRVKEAGLDGQIQVLNKDYRDLTGTFDHLVSIEMIEAVGHHYLDRFFGQCSRLINQNGCMVLQAITIPDYRFHKYVRSVDFIQKYIFPGGCLPSIEATANAVGRSTDFRFLHLEDFAYHYAETLACWRRRYWHEIEKVRALGFDERFVRMWNYYLAYCEAGFLENQIGVAQIMLAKPGCRLVAPMGCVEYPAAEGNR